MSVYDDLKKLYALPPYDKPGNYVSGDGYFLKSIENKYGKEEVERAKRELGIK